MTKCDPHQLKVTAHVRPDLVVLSRAEKRHSGELETRESCFFFVLACFFCFFSKGEPEGETLRLARN